MKTRAAPLLAAAVILLLAACGTASQSASLAAPAAGRGAAAEPALAAGSSGAAAASSGDILVGTPGPDVERSVTATYSVAPGMFLTSFNDVAADAVGVGGYIASSQTHPDSHGRIVRGEVTCRVPAARLSAFLDALPPFFKAMSIDFSTVDHTAQFVDVNARLASAHAHLAALQTLLRQATTLADITSLEQQIESVETEIDSDQGQLNLLTSQVVYATATVSLQERGAAAITPQPVLAGGIGAGWTNAIAVTAAIAEGVVSAAPVLVLAALAGLAAWWMRRRTRAGTAAAPSR